MLKEYSLEVPYRVAKYIEGYHLLIGRRDNLLTFKVFDAADYKKDVLMVQLQFGELPKQMQIGFANAKEVLQDFEKTDGNKFTVSNNILTFEMRIGTRNCALPFRMRSKTISYEDQIEYLLWKSQQKRQIQHQEKASVAQMNRLKSVIETQSKIIEMLNRQVETFKKEHQNIKETHQQLKSNHTHFLQQQQQMNKQLTAQKQVQKQHSDKIEQLSLIKPPSPILPIMSNSRFNTELPDNWHESASPIFQIMSSSSDSPQPKQPKQADKDNNKAANSDCQYYQKFFLEPARIYQSQSQTFKIIDNSIKFMKSNQQARQLCSTACLARPRAKIAVKLHRTQKHNIWIGVFLSQRINRDSTKRDKGALSYKLLGGKNLYENGQRSGLSIPQIKQGQIISVQVDRSSKIVRWLHNENCVCVRNLPHEWETHDLYPFVTMIDFLDQIEFL